MRNLGALQTVTPNFRGTAFVYALAVSAAAVAYQLASLTSKFPL